MRRRNADFFLCLSLFIQQQIQKRKLNISGQERKAAGAALITALNTSETQSYKQIRYVMFDETKYTFSYSSADNAIVNFTTVARTVRGPTLPVCTL